MKWYDGLESDSHIWILFCLDFNSTRQSSSRHSIADFILDRPPNDPVQKHKKRGSMSQAEIDELTNMMSRMKNMAIDCRREQDRQFERIDSLTNTVDHANIRLKDDTFRINKLL